LMCFSHTRKSSKVCDVWWALNIFFIFGGRGNFINKNWEEEIKIFIIIRRRRRSKKSYSDVYHAFIIFIARTRSSCVPLFARRNLTTNSE
jgi:hypothetical protein